MKVRVKKWGDDLGIISFFWKEEHHFLHLLFFTFENGTLFFDFLIKRVEVSWIERWWNLGALGYNTKFINTFIYGGYEEKKEWQCLKSPINKRELSRQREREIEKEEKKGQKGLEFFQIFQLGFVWKLQQNLLRLCYRETFWRYCRICDGMGRRIV